MQIHDLTGECCPENVPGYESTLHIVPACDVEDFPTIPAYDSSSPGDSVTLTGDIVLKANKKFLTIPIVMDSGSTMSTAQGNLGSKGFRNDANFEIQGNNADTLAWSQRALNGCYIALLEDKMGRLRVIGTKKTPAKFETIEHGNSSEDSKATYLLYDTTGRIAPIYEGTIDLDDQT